jgi:hypothetical protein
MHSIFEVCLTSKETSFVSQKQSISTNVPHFMLGVGLKRLCYVKESNIIDGETLVIFNSKNTNIRTSLASFSFPKPIRIFLILDVELHNSTLSPTFNTLAITWSQ